MCHTEHLLKQGLCLWAADSSLHDQTAPHLIGYFPPDSPEDN